MENTRKILVIDDSTDNLSIVDKMLKDTYKVFCVTSGKAALKFLEKHRPDLILMDVKMPEMSGYDLMKILKADPKLSDIPVIFLTALIDAENEAYAFELGAVDYIQKPFNSVIVKVRVKQHLEMESYRKDLQRLVDIKTFQVTQLQKITINMLANVTEFRDTDTGNHIKRTADYACAIMDNIPDEIDCSYRISASYYDDIRNSAPLHDIGKVCISDTILLKPGRLTNEEFEIIKTHVVRGGQILQSAIKEFNGPSFLDVAMELVMTHHEKWNGSGYPNGLKGEEIPLSGRIMALADVYDALTSARPYKKAFSHEKALQIIKNDSGTHFDPVLVNVFLNCEDEIKKIYEKTM